ncbi:HNH endonuclease signature motif containing protein [Mycobacterium asiaticum]|uniref:HNH nuclease domain-containing protein n=1 Tax=Mycobacterium asiaticum TaxID=1790 RepID=A0A1A3MV27_MYCAS|nr:HNH endonuclease signature motif containing protein [Mycobacterium asiaticum]OBK12659.1 hypothetical protein A5636_11715 [Mycobacterium asiaticum]
MFDRVADAALVDAMVAGARAEATAAAQRLAAIAELVARHGEGPADSPRWSCDNWDFMAAQVAAAQNISHGMASGQMYLACALRNRLPKVNALLAAGIISLRLASTIVWHTGLIKDPWVMSLVDAALAADAERYGPLSSAKTATAIDALISRHDPAAVRRTRSGARGRDVTITPADDQSGMASIWGSLLAIDAAVLDRRLDTMARDVCPGDPRTLGQRRADALGTLAADGKHLTCECQSPDCPYRDRVDARATAVVIHVVADAASVTAEPDPLINGELPAVTLGADSDSDPESASATGLTPAQIPGGFSLPATLLARLIAAGAKVAPLGTFFDTRPETRYRPSTALDRFIRSRDMTCRFPGCDAVAWTGDIDHTIAYPWGPTHPSNLNCLCRKHHLLKTFWTGLAGWRDRQHPDGTIVWTAPTGHTYTTRPGSRLLFPNLCLPTGSLPTGSLPTGTAQPLSPGRGIMMPTRRRTRAQDRAQRIDAERRQNLSVPTTAPVAPPREVRPPRDDDPPPF